MSEAEARKYASEIGAIFKLTSALKDIGIEELFKSLGSKLFCLNYKEDEEKYENNIVGKSNSTGGTTKLDENNFKNKLDENRYCQC